MPGRAFIPGGAFFVWYFHKVICETIGYEERTRFQLLSLRQCKGFNECTCDQIKVHESRPYGEPTGYGTYIECGRCGFLLEGIRD